MPSKRRWTVVIVPQGSSASKILEVSTTVLKLAGSVAIAVTLLAVLLGFGVVRRSIDLAHSDRLERENRALANELNLLPWGLSSLGETINPLEARDGHIRLLANLDPIDPQVRASGIGGPLTLETAAPSSPLLGRAGPVRGGLKAVIRPRNPPPP